MAKAWHFVNGALRNGDAIPENGHTLKFNDELVMCKRGLHSSKRLIDTLQYAPGATCCRVEIGGTVLRDTDKNVSSERTIIWRHDITDTLRRFARLCALDVIHLWDAPGIVVTYLKTGDEKLRAAAGDAARAAGDAARAAGDAARAAAGYAAWDAAWAAAWAAARAAARDAAWAAARAAARDAQNRRLTSMVIAKHRQANAER